MWSFFSNIAIINIKYLFNILYTYAYYCLASKHCVSHFYL